jgi:hypothetical protein
MIRRIASPSRLAIAAGVPEDGVPALVVVQPTELDAAKNANNTRELLMHSRSRIVLSLRGGFAAH